MWIQSFPKQIKMPKYLVKQTKSGFTYVNVPKDVPVAIDNSIKGHRIIMHDGRTKKYSGYVLVTAKSGQDAIRKVFG